MSIYLLDTNHCSHLLQGNPAILHRLSTLGEQPVATCVVVTAELIFMAYNSQQLASNLKLIEDFLSEIYIFGIDKAVAETYGQLKAQLIQHFGPKEKAKLRKSKLHHFGISDNDLWICSIAKYYDLTVVSQDSDFTRIKQVVDLELQQWL